MSEDLEKAVDRIAYYLGARDHSELELRTKLARRFPEDVVEQALVEARERNWLLAPEKLALKAAEEFGRKRKSHRYIQDQLRRRGLPAVERDSEAELAKMRRLMRGKFSGSLTYEEKTKAFRFLKYRGFEDALIRKVLHENLDE